MLEFLLKILVVQEGRETMDGLAKMNPTFVQGFCKSLACILPIVLGVFLVLKKQQNRRGAIKAPMANLYTLFNSFMKAMDRQNAQLDVP